VAAAIAGAFAPVFVESVAPLDASVTGGEVARPVDADAGAGAAFVAARFAASDALTLLEILVPFAAPAAAATVAVAEFGVEFALIAATLVFRPPAASAVAAAPCIGFVAACGLTAPPFNDAVEPGAGGDVAPAAGNSTVTACAVAPGPTGGVRDTEPAPAGGSGAAGPAADDPGTGDPAAGAAADTPRTGGPAAGTAAAGGGGGNGDGEELPPAGRWLPLESTPPAVLCIEVLRLGFPPASLKALAKSWLWAPIVPEFAAAALF
jgi:hypothetical protein